MAGEWIPNVGRKKTVRVKAWPRIREIQMATKTVWEVDTGSKLRNRIRKKLDTPEMAEALAEKLRVEHHNEGVSAFDLSMQEKQDAKEALALLNGRGVTLRDAVGYYLLHNEPPGGKKTVSDVSLEVLEYKEDRQRKRPRYVADLRNKFRSFIAEFGHRPVNEVTPSEIETWLFRDKEISELTRDNYYRALSVLFSFAQGRRDRRQATAKPYRIDNPMEAVTKPTFEREPPKILTVAQTKKLLRAARDTQADLGLLPYVVLSLFCGVRAEELRKLQWPDLNLKRKQITIPARVAKKRRLRNIPLPAAAVQWLRPFANCSGNIVPKNCDRRFQRLAKAAGFTTWPQNAMRHSFGSYFYAMTEDAQATTARLGQKGDDVLFEHYRALCGKHEANGYFALVPKRVV